MRRRIITASLFYGTRNRATGETATRACERVLVCHPPVNREQLEPLLTQRGSIDATHKTTAFVNHGRWMARCLFCENAEVVDPTDPYFICAGADGCMNLPIDGAYVPVKFPPDRPQIEAALSVRSKQSQVHWSAPQTAEQLLEENKLLGVA